MEWRIKLESKTGWGEVTEVEIATLNRRVTAATDEDIGLSLAGSKAILSTLQRAMVTGQTGEYVASAQICRNCLEFLPIRDRRTRKIQTLSGTVEVCAPRIRACACVNPLGLRGLSISPLAGLLPDRCTPELCRVQAELGARMSYREAAGSCRRCCYAHTAQAQQHQQSARSLCRRSRCTGPGNDASVPAAGTDQ